jgi:hypothetical protein
MGGYLSDIKVCPNGSRLCVLGGCADSRVKELNVFVDQLSGAIGVTIEMEFVLPFEKKVGTYVIYTHINDRS